MVEPSAGTLNKGKNAVNAMPQGALRRIHFIGIGGIGMSGIAAILQAQGYAVSGSDLKESPVTRKLAQRGVKVSLGHDALFLRDAEMVVYSSAIRNDNPELLAAKDKGLIVLRRAEALARLMQEKTCIAVSGAHGKTTTTALASHLLLQAGLRPTAAVGGILKNLDDNSCLGCGDFFVAEADESDGTFLYYRPDYPIVTNIDREHLDFYRSWDEILDAYARFIRGVRDNGCLFCCGDDRAIRQITKDYKRRLIYFGLSCDNDFYPRDVALHDFSSEFTCCYKGEPINRISLPLSGEHNISNSLGVIALGLELGISHARIKEALADFKGTERRFQLKADYSGIKVIDDYGHHPTEILATLKAAKNVAHKRLIVVFQPHRYSRTKFLMEEFAQSFRQADCLLLTDIYAASESPIEGVSSEFLAKKIRDGSISPAVFYIKKEHLIGHILKMIRPGDLVLTLGAGDIGKLSDELVQRIKGQDTL